MKLASVLTPISDENLTLAAQCGVDQIVVRYPGPDLSEFNRLQQRIRSFGMEIGVVEGYLPIDRIKLGTDDGTDLRAMKALIRHLSDLDIRLVCYNFMAGTDWIRTSVDTLERAGSKVTAFRLLISTRHEFPDARHSEPNLNRAQSVPSCGRTCRTSSRKSSRLRRMQAW